MNFSEHQVEDDIQSHRNRGRRRQGLHLNGQGAGHVREVPRQRTSPARAVQELAGAWDHITVTRKFTTGTTSFVRSHGRTDRGQDITGKARRSA
jgi:hypothetical protein